MPILLLIVVTFALIGCSSGANTPLTPQENSSTDAMETIPVFGMSLHEDGSFNALGMLGAYELTINPEDATAELVAMRTSAIGENYIVSGISFFTIAPCPTCLKLTAIALDLDGNAILTFSIVHPFPEGITSEPPSAVNRLDLDVFDLAMVIAPSEATAITYALTGIGAYPGFCIDSDGYTTELANVIKNTNAIPYFLAVDDSVDEDPPVATYNKFAMGYDTTFDVGFNLSSGILSFDMYLTMGYGFSAKKPDRLQPKYYNPEFNRKAAWKVVVTPPEGTTPPAIGNTWDDNDSSTPYNVTVAVYDWQQGATVFTGAPEEFGDADTDNVFASSEVTDVSVEIPGMNSALQSATTAGSGTGTPSDPLVYTLPIANENQIAAGEYAGLAKVTDERATLTPTDGRDFLIDTPNGIELVNYEMPEYATYQTFTATVVVGNLQPSVLTGVDGEIGPFILGIETYTVTASDPDGDTLSYLWTLTDVASMNELMTDVPGDPDGTIDIDFGALGVVMDGVYDIDCDVTDSFTAPVPATTLRVTATEVIYEYWADDDGAGDLSMGCNSGHAVNWEYLDSVTAWDENGNDNTYSPTGCSILQTPAITLPASGEVSAIHMVVNHRAYGHTNCTRAYNAVFLMFSTDDGGSWIGTRPNNYWTIDGSIVPNFGFSSPSETYCNLSSYSCCNQSLMNTRFNWGGLAWCANFNSWRDSDFTLDESQWDQDINMGFCWKIYNYCYIYPNHYGYQVRGVKIYVEP
jgi:hypothetical protein